MHSFSYLEPVCCSISSWNCFFMSCIQNSQEASQVVWYSHLFQNFPQLIVVHTVKGFGIVNKAGMDGSLGLSCFLMIQQMLAIWSLVPLPFLNPCLTSGCSQFTYSWSLAWIILSITLLALEMSAKTCPFHYRRLECKRRKWKNTWGNRQIWRLSMEWSRAKANRVLPREHAGHIKHPLPPTQDEHLHMDLTRWSTSKSD